MLCVRMLETVEIVEIAVKNVFNVGIFEESLKSLKIATFELSIFRLNENTICWQFSNAAIITVLN